MKLSEVMAEVYKAEMALELAKSELEYWVGELSDSECDHPEFSDHRCDNCGEYVEYSEEMLQEIDDSNVLLADATEGYYPFAPMSSQYFSWPQWMYAPPMRQDGPTWPEDDYLDSLESWQTYGLDS